MDSLPVLRASLGRAIRCLRQQTGYSQERFGFQIGVHRTQMGKLEGGKGNPTIETLYSVARGLGVSVPELFQLATSDRPEGVATGGAIDGRRGGPNDPPPAETTRGVRRQMGRVSIRKPTRAKRSR
jgi:transcriptional regulator with XRE-family HTH domain